jgi:hypothetical protein
LELTLPDSEFYIPEFGLCLPPGLELDFNPSSPLHDHAVDFSQNLSDTLQTPLTNRRYDNLTLDMSAGHDTLDSGFGDDGGDDGLGFGNDNYDDDGLANVDDTGVLDFDLGPIDPTPTRPRKRASDDDERHARYTSEGTDDEIQRNIRDDHNRLRHPDTPDNFDNFDNPGFDQYNTPSNLPALPVPRSPTALPDLEKPPRKRRRIVIVEDDACTIKDADFRSWQEKYMEIQIAGNAKKKHAEKLRIAKLRALNYIWGWGGRKENELPPGLAQKFSRTALVQRWSGKAPTVGRKRVEEVEFPRAEMGDTGGYGDGGFGDMGGGYDNADYAVRTSQLSLI